jgi:hypothetical protein
MTKEPAFCNPERDTLCAKTGEDIKAGEAAWWVIGVGIFKEKPTDEDINLVASQARARQGVAQPARSGGGLAGVKDPGGPGLVEVLEDTVCQITQVKIEKGEGAWFVGGVGYFKKKPTDEDFRALLKKGDS